MTFHTEYDNIFKVINQLENKEKITVYLERMEAMIDVACMLVRRESIHVNKEKALSYLNAMYKPIFEAKALNNKDFNRLLSEYFQYEDKVDDPIAREIDMRAKTEGVNNKVIFTSKETDCIQKLMAGKSPAEIAKELDLSENTIDFYLVNGIKKLNALRKQD